MHRLCRAICRHLAPLTFVVGGASGLAHPLAAQDGATDTLTLTAILDSAALRNRLVPTELGGYRARLESEISLGNRRAEGMEMSLSIEQVASTLTWDRTGRYMQQVTGYRTQAIATNISSLGLFRGGWAIPSLYGNRLALLFGRDTSTSWQRRSRVQGRDPLYAIHPLGDDRERTYRFRGGDVVQTVRTAGREIPVRRIEVTPRRGLPRGTVVFVGTLDLDATRWQIVRLRGHFAQVGERDDRNLISRGSGFEGIAYVEAVNAEVDGRFWLPAYQRFEVQGASPMAGEGRAIVRIVTRFLDRQILAPPPDVVVGAPSDTLEIRPFRLALGAPDSVSAYRDWTTEIGAMTAETGADDFLDVAPDRFNPRGPPRARFETERLSDSYRLDRVQGVFLGAGAVLRFRDAAPGLTLRTAGGWAFAEQTARGRVVIEQRRGRDQLALRLQRSLDLTNDFRNPYDSGSVLGALFGRDEYDYVDRRTASVQYLRLVGVRQRVQLRAEFGVAHDGMVDRNVKSSPFRSRTPFRENRLVTTGNYRRTMITMDANPDVALEFLRPGFGARLHYERGDGELAYQRAEARLTARANRGGLMYAARLDLGVTSPDAPPQQLFELGRQQNLPGYDYKAFAGDQAAVLRGAVAWMTPWMRAPVLITPRIWLPPVAPTLSLGLQSGWTRASNATALATVTALGSTESDHARTSASLTLRVLGGAVGVGIARTLDRPGPTRWFLEFGQRY